ncbi:MAG TPA: hypothetical protein VFG69_13935 [Nannocystaceae bacterium]|nr:hypothetical protein [Nannocystaceae bacterium]
MLTWLAAQGCAEPCVDDGLLQDPGGSQDCPALASADESGSATESDDVTVTVTETDSAGGDCNNGIQDGDETDVDCGGPCDDKCGNGQGCGSAQDCMSGVCADDGTCTPPSCDDGIQNGDETDVDCGGSCPTKCDTNDGCIVDADCDSMNCDEGTGLCLPPADDCNDGMQNGDETDVDCGGSCPTKCDDGDMCLVGEDCSSTFCDPDTQTCTPPACDDGVQNGDETDVDCGGSCGNTCGTGDDCLVGTDCIDDVCDPDDLTCAPPLTVDVAPACVDFAGAAVQLTATASGGTGTYTYAWTPAGGLDDATSATPLASPTEFTTYTVTVDDGVNQANDTGTVVNASAFDLQDNCTLYQGVFLGNTGLASITYSQMGTVACENGNNDFGLHLCENVVFQDVQLRGILQVTNDGNDDDIVGLVWGAQDSSTFYSLSWKRVAQNFFGCNVPAGMVVKRVEAADFAALTGTDVYCAQDTVGSTLLLDPSMTTTDGWEEGEEYLVTIDYLTTGSSVTVTRVGDNAVIAMFDVADSTFQSGFFGSTTISQENACVGPLNAACL